MNLPPYPVFPQLTSEYVNLRQIMPGDIPGLVEIAAYDQKQAQTIEEATQIQEMMMRDYQNGLAIHWGIADKNNNDVMGTCGYYRGFENGKSELGCILKPEFRGYGFMSSAIRCAMDFGIHHIQLKKIVAITTLHNLKAIAVLERLQFIRILELENDGVEYEFVTEHNRG